MSFVVVAVLLAALKLLGIWGLPWLVILAVALLPVLIPLAIAAVVLIVALAGLLGAVLLGLSVRVLHGIKGITTRLREAAK